MKIGFDGKRAVSNMTGLGNYSRFVIDGMAQAYPDDEMLIYVPKMKDSPRLRPLLDMGNVQFRFPAPQGLKGGLWRSFGITNNLRADGVDVFHGLSNELPLNIRSSGVPSVLTMHDVIYRRMPECYKPLDRWIYDYKYGHSCKNADHIIAVSERTKGDIVEFYGVDPEKITVIYQGCDPQFRRHCTKDEIEEVRKRLNLPQRYILQVGTIEKRKNLELTVKALQNISPDVFLVVVGRDHHGYKKEIIKLAIRLGVLGRILFLEGLPFRDLPGVYQASELVVYPSRYEGFGIPVLEALESSKPVIAATGSCLEEAGGDDTLYINPDSPEDLISAVHAILCDPGAARQMVESGKEYAKKFRSEDMAREIHAVYEITIEKFRAKHKR